MTDDNPKEAYETVGSEPGSLPPQAVDVAFLIAESELRDRKKGRRTHDLPHRSKATEDGQLREMASAGFSAAEIAEKLGRPPRSIRDRASTLGIRLAPQALRFRTFARKIK